jgi:hypothetical protein
LPGRDRKAAAPLSDRIVHYKIDARLDVKAKTIAGTETLTWRNATDVPASDLWFHIYLNAFKNTRSTFMKESGGSHRGFKPGDDQWGSIDITKIGIKDGADLTRAWNSSIGRGNADDQTVVASPSSPSRPAGRSPRSPSFQTPQVFASPAGNFMVGRGSQDRRLENGAWNCHRTPRRIHADFGVFGGHHGAAEYVVEPQDASRLEEQRRHHHLPTPRGVTSLTAATSRDPASHPDDPPVRRNDPSRPGTLLKDRYEQALRNGPRFWQTGPTPAQMSPRRSAAQRPRAGGGI